MFGLRRITIFLSSRRIKACDFKSGGNQLLTADPPANRAFISLMMLGDRVMRRYPTAPWRGADRRLLANQRKLSLVVILWRAVLGGVGSSCCRIQFWILVDSSCWRYYLAWCSQRIIEVWEIRLIETVYGVLWDLLLCLGFVWTTTIYVWRGCGFISVLNIWKVSFISLWSIILRSKKNLHCFFIW